MKKIIIVPIISMFFIGGTATQAFADSPSPTEIPVSSLLENIQIISPLNDLGVLQTTPLFSPETENLLSEPAPPLSTELPLIAVSQEISTFKVPVAFKTSKVKTDDLYVGQTSVKTVGKKGQAVITRITKSGGVDSTEENFSILKSPVEEVILVGTAPKPTEHPEVAVAYSELGKPYVWGGNGPNVFDCSGLVYWVFNHAGWNIPRLTAGGYGNMGQSVSWANIEPGDVVWTYQHIGIYVGDGKVIHAANPRAGVKIESTAWFINSGFKVARLKK